MRLNILASAFLSICGISTLISQNDGLLKYHDNLTLTYDEVITAYNDLDQQYKNALLIDAGITDCGKPLHLFLIGTNLDPDKSIQQMAAGRTVLLINNGIHPGESCGIDASIEFSKKVLDSDLNDDLLIAIIPVYNVGGALNRGKHFRANQNGPLYHGFRGNAQNLDLNRDFIKADALNTLSFYAIFHALKPHVFIDTHTSNGADYQYTISFISTQKDKLNPILADHMTNEMEPYLYADMKDRKWELTPYVNVFGRTPDDGFSAFLETPRFASGYTTLFNCIGFITETHMLKPYEDRVLSTLAFLESMNAYLQEHSKQVFKLREQAERADRELKLMDINWVLDSSDHRSLNFKGYAYSYDSSALGPYQRLRYHKDQPKDIALEYYPSYKTADSARIPRYYVLPQAWRHVVRLLQYNQVQMQAIPHDTSFEVSLSYITDNQFVNTAYEGHHPVRQVSTRDTLMQQQYFEGDFLIPLDQNARRFLMAVLEPRAVDSYLRWNFFDAIFQQKEYFSAYVFEETAALLLEKDPDLQRNFEAWKQANPQKAQSSYLCLDYIYKRSPYYEMNHLKYPVGRIF